jgi:hypothetical protein
LKAGSLDLDNAHSGPKSLGEGVDRSEATALQDELAAETAAKPALMLREGHFGRPLKAPA